MQNEWNAGIAQIATFMICAQAIAHFRPRESYGKYLRMLISVMILVQIFQPFCSLFFGVSSQEMTMAVAEFQEKLEESMAEAVKASALVEEKQESMSLSEVQERLAVQEDMAQEGVGEQEQQVTEANGEEKDVGGVSVETVEIEVNVNDNRK